MTGIVLQTTDVDGDQAALRAAGVDIDDVMPAYALFSIFKIGDDIFDLEVFWRYAPSEGSKQLFEETIKESVRGRWEELIRSKLAYTGVVADRVIAEKWSALRDCPAGSWGKAVADFYDRHGFPFPGERYGIYELGARHDWVHVLAGYETTPEGERAVAGTLFGNAAPRLVDIFGVSIEAELAGEMIYIVNEDQPGFIGRLGTTLGEAGVNIGTFHLGRRQAGGEAVALVSVDGHIAQEVVRKLEGLPGVKRVKPLRF